MIAKKVTNKKGTNMTSAITLDPMIYHENISSKTAHAQVVYLFEVKKLCFEKIAEITRYAVSTVRGYVKKFANLLDYALNVFRSRTKKAKENSITWEVEYQPKPCAYIIEFFDKSGFRWLKIGKANDIRTRAPQHLSFTEYGKHGITSSVIRQVFYVDSDDDALIMESMLRKHYKAKENHGFISRDRFGNCHYDCEDIMNDKKLIEQYQFLGYTL